MPRHTLTHADELFVGNAVEPKMFGGKRGTPVSTIVQVDLGTPVVGAANSVCASQAVLTGVAALLNGSTAGTLDYPRNVVAAWTGTAIVTVTGTDVYGKTLVERSASGTSLTGKKAFKTVTSVTFNADVTGATVGHGDVLGLPYRLGGKYDMLAFFAGNTQELATATVVAGDATAATATTGDVRGTVDPATTLDGTVRFRAWYKIFGLKTREESYGIAQYAG